MHYKVKDISMSEMGEKQVRLAENEMPGLMLLREELRGVKPLEGARIVGCLHMTIETAVLIDSLVELGAEVKWSSCNIYSTNDAAAAYIAKQNIPVFAWKNQTEKEYRWCIEKTLEDWKPNLLLDDGGDLTDIVHEHYPNLLNEIKGVSEETTTGIARATKRLKVGKLKIPLINVNDSVTKSKFDNFYGCKESVIDGIKRATDMMIAGKKVVVLGYGNVGKGCAEAFKLQGAKVIVTEIDPICALQAAMSGFEVLSLESVVKHADIFITATGNKHAINWNHIQEMKDGALIGNIGHFDNEIDIKSLEKNGKWMNIKPQFDQITINNKRILLLARGRLLNLGCATGHSAFVMSTSFANQILAQIELWNSADYIQNRIYLLPKILDEKVARLHLKKLGVELTRLNKDQSLYLNLDIDGPYKSDNYKY